MILPARRQPGHQERFTPEPTINSALKRIALGDFYEELTATWLRAERFTTQSGIPCPDIIHTAKGITRFFEVKTVGKRRQPTIPEKQLKDYAQWYPSTYYVFWFHEVEFDDCTTKDDLRREAAMKTRDVLVVSIARLMLFLDTVKAKPMKVRADGTHKQAYRCPLRSFKNTLMIGQTKHFHAVKLRDYWVGSDWPIRLYEAV